MATQNGGAVPAGGAGSGFDAGPFGCGCVPVGMPFRSGAGTLVSGGGDDAPGMYGVFGFGTVAPGGGTTTGAVPGPVLIGPKGGGVTGPPPATPGPVGIGLQTPPNEPAADAGGFAGQK